MTSAPACCLSDIPIAHLAYHAYRYGKFAVGFHRDSAIKGGFNPVFYTLESTRIIKSVYRAMSYLGGASISGIFKVTEEIKAGLAQIGLEDASLSLALDYVDAEAGDAKGLELAARTSFDRLLAFTKTFSPEEFSSIYCEREWRSLDNYSFSFDDIAMIVLPKKAGEGQYFSTFVEQELEELNLPRSVPVVPWEDLIEH